nr:FKBP-type peptidyl-prolyl cis-trans isomerase [Saprospiraceae bacterium]
MDSLSYSVGLILAQNLKQQGLTELDGESLKQGIVDLLEENELKVDLTQANQILQEHMAKQNLSKWEKNIRAEQEFLAENKNREGVKELPSGIQYKVITEGDGPIPSATDQISAHYHGMLIDGRVFDSSVNRGQPATFPVNGVIQGWQEVLQLMPVGSKWKVFIPSALAYGERGAGDMIDPYSMLIFEIELLEIK